MSGHQKGVSVCSSLSALLTSCIAVKQEGVLELKVQVFGDWFRQVLHAESVHNGETMPGRCQSDTRRGHDTEIMVKNLCKSESTSTLNQRHFSCVMLSNRIARDVLHKQLC